MLLPMLCGLALLCSCSKDPTSVNGERVWVVPEPEPELTLTVHGRVGHRTPESVKAPASELRLAWMASEGSLVEAGDIVARYDTELLDLWLQSNREDLAILERRTRAAEVTNERSLYNLRARLVDTEANRKSASLAYELSKDFDASERGILERELALSRKSLADARRKLEAIQEIQAVGGAAAAEVREAMAAYERALANVRIPEVNLEVFDDVDGRRTRMQLDQTLAKLGLALGDEEQHGSLRSRLAIFAAQQEQDLMWVKLEKTRINEEAKDAQVVIDDAFHRTEEGGVIDPKPGRMEIPLVPGAELGSREIASVISAADTAIEVFIPEAIRESVRIKGGKGYRVDVRIPSLGPDWYAGKLQSVSVVKQQAQSNAASYLGTVILEDPPLGLNLGAGVDCRIQLQVPETAVVIPRWWATRAFRPLVRMADGETRRLHAQVVGDWLLVSNGLHPGDQILPPARDETPNLVLYSAVDIADGEEISIGSSRPWEWELLELADDGSTVTNGQVIARLRQSHYHGSKTRENSAEIERLKAEAARNLNRMGANGKLGTAYMDWQEARIDAELARVEYEIDRQATVDEAAVSGQVSAQLASIERKQVEEEYERHQAPIYEDIRSGNQRAQDRLGARVARLQDGKAGLSAAAATHSRNWPDTWSAKQNWQRLAAIETASEQAYKRAESTHRREITAVEATYERQMKNVERLGNELGQREVTSPKDGRIYLNTNTYYPISVGHRLPSGHLFTLPTGLTRHFELNIPSRRYREFALGQEIAFYLPAEGTKRQRGKIVHIADFFEKRSSRPKPSWRGHRRSSEEAPEGASESTVRVTVEFECRNEEDAPPGMTVVVELDA